jgi:polyhydroxyalkanoate synthesis regulator phasin
VDPGLIGLRRFAALTDDDIGEIKLEAATQMVRQVLRELKSMHRRTEYQCAKMPSSVERLVEAANARLAESSRMAATDPRVQRRDKQD